MIPWVHIDSAAIPGETAELRLMRRGHEFSIMLGANELMNSRLFGSEQALAELASARIDTRPSPNILIGGLGMGFTLRAALAASRTDARIVVAELVPSVVGWARGPLAPVFGQSLADPRVTIVETDVHALIASARGEYDAILLDVDNGPDALTRATNDDLYSATGLAEARRALRSGAVLAVWSAGPNPQFTQRLKRAGFAVEEHGVRANARRGGARHLIWLATKA